MLREIEIDPAAETDFQNGGAALAMRPNTLDAYVGTRHGEIRIISLKPQSYGRAAIEAAKAKRAHNGEVLDIAFERLTGALYASAGNDSQIVIVDTLSGETKTSIGLASAGSQRRAMELAFYDSGRSLVAGLESGTLSLFDTNSGKNLGVLTPGSRTSVTALETNPAVTALMAVDRDGGLRIWRLPSLDLILSTKLTNGIRSAIFMSNDTIALGNIGGDISVAKVDALGR